MGAVTIRVRECWVAGIEVRLIRSGEIVVLQAVGKYQRTQRFEMGVCTVFAGPDVPALYKRIAVFVS